MYLFLLRAGAVIVLTAATAMAVKLGVADYRFKDMTAAACERAIAITPNNAEYHRWLGIFLLGTDPARSERELRTAIRLNPWDADAFLRLGMLYESQARMQESEQQLLAATKVDATFLPRWSLANFYFRQGRTSDFWNWLKSAVRMSYNGRSQIFDLAFASGASDIAERLDLKGAELWTYYLFWATYKAPPSEIHRAGVEVARAAPSLDPEKRAWASTAIRYAAGKLIADGHTADAIEVWNAGVQAGLVLSGATGVGQVTNAQFRTFPESAGFDWIVQKPNGGNILPETASGGLRIRLTGDQAEVCDLVLQHVAVEPRASYRLKSTYWTRGLNRESGLKWAVLIPQKEPVTQPAYLWDDGGGEYALNFDVPAETKSVLLSLRYQRPNGQVRASGEASIQGVSLTRVR